MNKEKYPKRNSSEEEPPVFKSWTKLYIFVLLISIITIAFFYFFTKAFK